jgi:hypothetical protein
MLEQFTRRMRERQDLADMPRLEGRQEFARRGSRPRGARIRQALGLLEEPARDQVQEVATARVSKPVREVEVSSRLLEDQAAARGSRYSKDAHRAAARPGSVGIMR